MLSDNAFALLNWDLISLRYAARPWATAASADDSPGRCCNQKIDFQISPEF